MYDGEFARLHLLIAFPVPFAPHFWQLSSFEKWKHKYQANILHTLSCNDSQYNKQLLMKNHLKAEISGFMIYSMQLIKKEIFIASHIHLAPSQ